MPSIIAQEVDTAGVNGVYVKTDDDHEIRIYQGDILVHYDLEVGGLAQKYSKTVDWVIQTIVNATGGALTPNQITFNFDVLTGRPTELSIGSGGP